MQRVATMWASALLRVLGWLTGLEPHVCGDAPRCMPGQVPGSGVTADPSMVGLVGLVRVGVGGVASCRGLPLGLTILVVDALQCPVCRVAAQTDNPPPLDSSNAGMSTRDNAVCAGQRHRETRTATTNVGTTPQLRRLSLRAGHIGCVTGRSDTCDCCDAAMRPIYGAHHFEPRQVSRRRAAAAAVGGLRRTHRGGLSRRATSGGGLRVNVSSALDVP